MSKWKCEICGDEFNNFHAQGFDNKIYCPLCYFKRENQQLKEQLEASEKARKDAISYIKRTSGYDNPYNDTYLNTYAVDNLLDILDIDKGE